jgi:AcrR family transcriptional regulator
MKTQYSGIDRRVARTRGRLQQALIELIPERGFAAITVDDVCKRADVGRSTFYTHYADKEALRSATIDEHVHRVREVRKTGDAKGGGFAFSLPMFEHAAAFGPLHRALIADRGDHIHDTLRGEVRRAVWAEMPERMPDDVSRSVAAEFVAGAFLALLGWWIEGDLALAPQEMDSMFQALAGRALGGPEPQALTRP